jgi:DNA-binding phage protein
MKHKPYITHNEAAIEMLHEDPQFAAEYLNAVLEDGNQKEFMLALPSPLKATPSSKAQP